MALCRTSDRRVGKRPAAIPLRCRTRSVVIRLDILVPYWGRGLNKMFRGS